MKKLIIIPVVLAWLFFPSHSVVGQISVEHHDDLQSLVQNVFVSGGVKVFNVRFRGDNEGNVRAIGSFRRGASGPLDIFSRGLILSTGNVMDAIGPNQVPNSTFIEADASHSYRDAGVGDPDLQRLVVPPTYDAAVLEFEFEAQSDSIFFRYIFASEEYTEWVDEPYNDVFAFFISGPGIVGLQNIALLPDRQAVAVNSVNHLRNTAFYIDNAYVSPWRPAPHNVRYDGFTRVLVAKAQVIPCRRYRLKLAIADVEDQVIDSAVLLEAFSLTSRIDTVQVVGGLVPGTQHPTTWESCGRDIRLVYRRRNTARELRIPISLGGTARNQLDYRLSTYEFLFPAGVDTAVIHVQALWDELPEGTESVSLTYRPIGACEDHTVRFFIQDAYPRLIVEPSQSITRCGMPGDTVLNLRSRVELTGGSFEIDWRDPWGRIVNQGANWTFRPVSDTLLRVHATDRICNIPVPPISWNYRLLHFDRQNPLAFRLPDTVVCRNATLTFRPQPRNGTGNYTYAWSDGSTSNSLFLNIVQPVQITLRVSDECQSAIQNARIEVHQSNIQVPNAFLVCEGTRIDIQPSLSSTSGWSGYQWIDQFSQTVVSTESRLDGWLADQDYDLRFEAFDRCGEIHAGLSQIRRFPKPEVELSDTVGICEGEPYSILPRMTGAGLRNFRWTRLRDGEIVSRSLILTGLAAQDEHYQFEFEDTCSVSVQYTVFLKVSPRTLEVSHIRVAPSLLVCPGSWVELNVEAQSGSGFYTYRWSHGSTLAQTGVQVTGPQSYSVTVSDGCMSFSRSIQLDVFPEPVLKLNQGDTLLCSGSQIQLSAMTSGGSGSWETINWLNDALELVGQGNRIDRTFNHTERIWAEVLDGCRRPARDSLLVTLHPDLSLNPITDRTLCFGESVRLEALATGALPLTYTWYQLEDSLRLGLESVLTLQPASTQRYSLMVSDVCQTQFSEFEIRVIQPTFRLDELRIDPGLLVCQGKEVSIVPHLVGGSGDYTYDWSTSSRSPSIQTVIEGHQSIRLIVGDGCQVIDTTIQFRVHPLPRIVVPDSVTLCSGEPVTLIGQGTGGDGQWTRIEWQNPQGMRIGNEFRLRFEPQTSGTHRLIVQDGCRFVAEDSVLVRLIPIAELSLPSDTAICAGQSVQIQSRIVGSNPSTRYSWSPPTGLDDPTRPDPTARPSFNTRYQLRAWTDGCSSKAVEIEIRVRELPHVELKNEFIQCEGRDSVTLEAESIRGEQPLTYLWQPEQIIFPTGSARSRAYSTHSESISLTVRDRFGCETRSLSRIRVAETPIIVSLADTFFCRGEPGVQLELRTSTRDQVHWSWTPQTGIGGINFNRPWLRPDTTQLYQLVATSISSGCSSDTLSLWVSVFDRPVAQLGPDRTACLGDSVILQADISSNHNKKIKFTWYIGELTTNDTSSSRVVWPNYSTTFFVQAYDSLCVGPLDSVRVSIVPTPTVSILQLVEPCLGDTVSLRANVAGSSNYQIHWHPTNSFLSNDSQLVSFVADSSRKIWVELQVAECQTRIVDSAYVKVINPASMGAARTPSPHIRRIYRGDTLQLDGWSDAGPESRFSWDPSLTIDNPQTLNPWAKPTSTTTFTLTVMDGPCLSRDSILIEVVDRVQVRLQPPGRLPVCEGDTVRLKAIRNFPGIEFRWFPLPMYFEGDSIAVFVPLRSETYQLWGTDPTTREADSSAIEIEVVPKPVAAFDWAVSEPCSANVISFENLSLNTIYSLWNFGDRSVPSNETHPYHQYTRSGKYEIRLWVQNRAGCRDSTSDWVQVQRFPAAEAVWTARPTLPTRVYLPESEVEIQVKVDHAKEWWLEWGDGAVSRQALANRHRYQQSGSFAPLLVLVDSGGCSTSLSLPNLEVLEPILHLPNAFSPNGDGINDIWQLFYRGSEIIRLQIRTRTNQVLFESNMPEASWDGTFQGQAVPEGIYLVEVEVGAKSYRQIIHLVR